MAQRTLYTCDKCKKEVEVNEHSKWGEVHVEARLQRVYHTYELCPECMTKLGIVLPPEPTNIEYQSIEDRLYKVIEDIVRDAMVNNDR